MPKMRTVKSAAKRIQRITRTGKILRSKMSAQHRRKGKSKRTKREAGTLPVRVGIIHEEIVAARVAREVAVDDGWLKPAVRTDAEAPVVKLRLDDGGQ